MGIAIFAGFVGLAVIVIGFMTYGVFLGIGTLVGQVHRTWIGILDFDPEARTSSYPDPRLEGELRWTPPEERCWQQHRCPPAARSDCPAFRMPDLPCWLASMQASEDYKLRPDCLTCKLFNIPALMTHA